jgi:hypothetical protein
VGRALLTIAATVVAAATWVPSAEAGTQPCRSSELRLVLHGSQGAAGTLFELLRLEPRRGVSCTMGGYPGVSLLGRRGRRLPIQVGRERGSLNRLRTLTFAHRRSARFDLRHPSTDLQTNGCPTNTFAIRVIPPNETHALTVRPRHPLRFCRRGARVTPVGRHY